MQIPKQPEPAWGFALGMYYGKKKKEEESYWKVAQAEPPPVLSQGGRNCQI